MTVRIIWTDAARADLRAIHDYIARDSQMYAIRVIEQIKSKVESIIFPEASAMVPEWNRPDIRETFVASFRIIYRITANTIEVLAVIHSARQLPDEDNLAQK